MKKCQYYEIRGGGFVKFICDLIFITNQLFHHTVLPIDAPSGDSINPLPLFLVLLVDHGLHSSPECQSPSPGVHLHVPSIKLAPRAVFFQVFLRFLHWSLAEATREVFGMGALVVHLHSLHHSCPDYHPYPAVSRVMYDNYVLSLGSSLALSPTV